MTEYAVNMPAIQRGFGNGKERWVSAAFTAGKHIHIEYNVGPLVVRAELVQAA